MFEWKKGLNWKKIFKAALLFLIVATVVRQIEVIVTMKYYLMPEFFSVWSKLMMPKAGPPPAGFMITSLIFTFLTGVVLATLYDFIKGILPKDKKARALSFFDIVIIFSLVTFTLPAYLLFNLPFGLLVTWFISSAIIFLVSSYIFVKVLE